MPQKRLSQLSSFEGSGVVSLQKMTVKLLNAPSTDYCMGFVIVLNIFVMIIEIDRGASETKDQTDSGKTHWTEVFGYGVLLVFVIELLLRLFAFRWAFFKDGWNVFDFVIVFTDAVMFFLSLVGEDLFPVSILRIFRLSKLARVSKILRVFPELRMLLASLMSSLSTIFWGACMLFLVLLVWSMIAVLLIHPLNKDVDYDGCERCPRAYASVMDAALTFWQQIVAGDSWGMATIPLIEEHPGTVAFFVPLFLTVGLALMNLILGVVVTVAQQKKDDLEASETMENNMITLEKETGFFALCKQMDSDCSGELEKDELYAGFEEGGPPEFRESMSALGITKDDFDVVWAMLDIQKTGAVPYDRLVRHLYGMRQSTSEFTLAYLKYYVTIIRDMLLDQGATSTLKNTLEAELNKLGKKEDVLLERQEQLLEKLVVAPCDTHNLEHKVQGKGDQAIQPAEQGISAGMEKFETFEVNLKSYDRFCEHLIEIFGFDNKAAQEEWNRRKLLPDKYQQRLNKHGCMSIELDILAFKKQLAREQEKSSQKSQGAAYDAQQKEHKSKSHDRLKNHPSIDGSLDQMSAETDDDMQIWLRRVCQEIGMMRVDMKDMMLEVNRKLISREGPPATEQSILSPTKPHMDLLVVPDKSSAAPCGFLQRC